MSPDQLHEAGSGYDGRLADVWASGVLLMVCLLGRFPYEDHEHHATGREVRFEVRGPARVCPCHRPRRALRGARPRCGSVRTDASTRGGRGLEFSEDRQYY
jgi:hypothetical protein